MEIIRYHEFNFRILAASVMIEEREYLAAGIAVIQLRYRIQRLHLPVHQIDLLLVQDVSEKS